MAAAAPPSLPSVEYLPREAQYVAQVSRGANLSPTVLKSSRTMRHFFPQNAGAFGPSISRTIRFDIASDTFTSLSEARIVADFQKTSAGSAILDGGMGGCIQRITVSNSRGEELERIDDYAVLQTLLLQCSDRARNDESGLWLEEAFIADPDKFPLTMTDVAAAARADVNTGQGTLEIDNLTDSVPAGTTFTIANTIGVYTTLSDINRKVLPGGGANATDPKSFTFDFQPELAANVANGSALTFHTTKFTFKHHDTRELSHCFQTAWFQTHKKRLLPPGVMYKVEIELVDNANQNMASDDTTDQTWTWNNVRIEIPEVRIMSQSFQDATQRLQARGWSWSGASYHRHAITRGENQAQTTLQIPDSSVALTGLLAISRQSAQLNKANMYQNYFRDGNAFDVEYNMDIGGVPYPPAKIKYVSPKIGTVQIPYSVAGAGAASKYELQGPIQQVKAVLGHAPYDPSNSRFGLRANNPRGTNNAKHGVPGFGLGLVAIQLGYNEGQGIDTQTMSLPVRLDINNQTNLAASTLTIFMQRTMYFQMTNEGGMMVVQSAK